MEEEAFKHLNIKEIPNHTFSFNEALLDSVPPGKLYKFSKVLMSLLVLQIVYITTYEKVSLQHIGLTYKILFILFSFYIFKESTKAKYKPFQAKILFFEDCLVFCSPNITHNKSHYSKQFAKVMYSNSNVSYKKKEIVIQGEGSAVIFHTKNGKLVNPEVKSFNTGVVSIKTHLDNSDFIAEIENNSPIIVQK